LANNLFVSQLQNEEQAFPPYPRQGPSVHTAIRQYVVMVSIMLAEYRTTWFFQVFMGLLIPAGIIFFLKSVGVVKSPAQAIFLLGGNMATSIAFGPTNFLITKIGWAKQIKEFDYWIALPLAKFTLVFAIITISLLFALPGLVGIYLMGSLLFGLALVAHHLFLLPLLPLCVLPMTALGTLLGCYSRDGQTANMLSNLVLIFVGFLSPMMIPNDVLPLPLQIVARFVPTTYVADAFRAVLSNQMNLHFEFDVYILIFFAVLFLSLSYVFLDWRTK